MYDVVLLVEQELTEPDAKRVVELHQDMPETVKYHVLVPCHNAEAGVEASLSALGTADLYGAGLADPEPAVAGRSVPTARGDRDPRDAGGAASGGRPRDAG